MENNKKNFWKGALAGALAMFMVGAAALGIMNVAGVDLGTSQEKVVNAQEEKKLNKLKKLIDENYLYTDDLKEEDLENGLYSGYINALGDPYSVYYDEEQTKSLQESTSGEYSGIGVVFSQNQETKVITAVQVYENSPANEAGIQVNDILYKVGDKDVSGTDLSDVVQLIRGVENTTVDITVLRGDDAKEVTMTVTRRKIQVETVKSEMKDDQIGYIRVTEFDSVTYDQFKSALGSLEDQGMKGLVVDLRANPGGNLATVTQMLDLLLPKGTIVSTKDKSGHEEVISSDDEHQFTKPMSVVVDGNSASASEIFAGAIQDNDRGNIVGRRSFGKGLVQEQRLLPDNSALRLTVARYYVPSGRSIQKPYDEGKEKYYTDIYQRLLHGEFSQKDSIHFDEKLKFQTVGGRTVYGGGGIMPDLFVPGDTVGFSRYLVEVNRKNQYLYDFTFDFMDRHRQETKNIMDYKQLLKYLDRFDLVNEMADYAAARGLKRDEKGIRDSYDVLDSLIKAFIGRHVLDDDGFYPIFYQNDVTIKKAIVAQGTGVQAD